MIELYTDDYFMQEALKEAQKALEIGEVPVGAVVVCAITGLLPGHITRPKN
jgi:tRNA(Arg) A34 adenosine deaminase TadA